MELLENYKKYTIHKGTLLFRKDLNSNINEEMFFGFSHYGTYSSSSKHVKQIQIWETTCDIDGFLMLKDNSTIKRKFSSIIDIYNWAFPDNKLDDNYYVEIKKYSNERTQLVHFLKSKKISNWICSLENKYEMELFLFNGIECNSKLVRLNQIVDINSDYLTDIDTFNHNMISNCR